MTGLCRLPAALALTPGTRSTLQAWVRAVKTGRRLADRARIVLAAADGQPTIEIARSLRIRPATVSKWRVRFSRAGLSGLQDAPRPGAIPVYDENTERRILAQLDAPPPRGHATWTGALAPEALGDVSKHQVWRAPRREGIHLQRRRSWCMSTGPQFAAKAAGIAGLYLNPPGNAVVLPVDEKPRIQALERAQGYLKLPSGKAVAGFSHEDKRHGTTTLSAALDVPAGKVVGGRAKRRRRRDFLALMNEAATGYPGRELHVVLDNLNTHKPKHERWLARHQNVHLHFTPTHASWLNQIECWFSILSRRELRGASFTSPRHVREAIDRFIAACNEQAAPFGWTKREVHNAGPGPSCANLRN